MPEAAAEKSKPAKSLAEKLAASDAKAKTAKVKAEASIRKEKAEDLALKPKPTECEYEIDGNSYILGENKLGTKSFIVSDGTYTIKVNNCPTENQAIRIKCVAFGQQPSKMKHKAVEA